ncbi:hypothetical protein, partial [Kozakia baliensis]
LKRVRDIDLVATLLGLRTLAVAAHLDAWPEAPIMSGYAQPKDKGSWSHRELTILGQMWHAGELTKTIAKTLRRSRSSVSAKRRAFGLPCRQQCSKAMVVAHLNEVREAALVLGNDTVLSWAQASTLSAVERRGRTWYLRNTISQATLTAMEKSNKVHWNDAARIEVAHRYFARQAHRMIAAEFLVSPHAVRSHASFEECSPEGTRTRTRYYVMADALSYIAEHKLVRRKCTAMDNAHFWTERRSGRRISKRFKATAAARGSADAYALAA